MPPPRLNPPSLSKWFLVILSAYRISVGEWCWSLMSSTRRSDPTPVWSHSVKHSDKSSMKPVSIALPTSLSTAPQSADFKQRQHWKTSYTLGAKRVNPTYLKDIARSTLLPRSITFFPIAGTKACATCFFAK